MYNVLVTGGAGFIGSSPVEKLLGHGYGLQQSIHCRRKWETGVENPKAPVAPLFGGPVENTVV
ncbi:MAG TPA: hypothetical protein VN549_07870 [Negativicutes bacterium]|nr:hypothetical protein [Negativicutes bacterium]